MSLLMRGFYKRTFRQHHFTFRKRSFSALLVFLVLGVLVRQDALEEGAECLFTKLRALVCQVCVNQFLLLIVLVLGLARGYVPLLEGDVGRAQYGGCNYVLLFIFIVFVAWTASLIVILYFQIQWLLGFHQVRQAWSWVLPSVGIGKVDFKSVLSPY